jgi:hypothetical protein
MGEGGQRSQVFPLIFDSFRMPTSSEAPMPMWKASLKARQALGGAKRKMRCAVNSPFLRSPDYRRRRAARWARSMTATFRRLA